MFLGSFSERTILFNERKKELFVAFFFFAVFEIIYFKRRLSVSRRAATMKKQQRYDIFSYFFSFVRLFTTFKTDARCFPCHCIWALKHFLFDDDDNGSNKCSFTYVAIIIFQIFFLLVYFSHFFRFTVFDLNFANAFDFAFCVASRRILHFIAQNENKKTCFLL